MPPKDVSLEATTTISIEDVINEVMEDSNNKEYYLIELVNFDLDKHT